jgi:hypothetical protein
MIFHVLFFAAAFVALTVPSIAQDCFIYFNYYFVDEEPPMTGQPCWEGWPIPDGPTAVNVYEYPSGRFLGVNTTFNGQAYLGAPGYFISFGPVICDSACQVYAVVRLQNMEYISRVYTLPGELENIETIQSDWSCWYFETWAFFRFVYPGDSLCSGHLPLTSDQCWTGTPIPDGTQLTVYVNGHLRDSLEMNSDAICLDTTGGGFFVQQEPFTAFEGDTIRLEVSYDSCRYWTNSFALHAGYQEFALTEADWNCDFIQSGVESPAIPMPGKYALHPNFPNPFNPATTIRYDVPATGEVNLSVFNLLGQQVAMLFDGIQFAGSHTIVWEASNSPSGVYLCRMEAANFVQTRKLVLLK